MGLRGGVVALAGAAAVAAGFLVPGAVSAVSAASASVAPASPAPQVAPSATPWTIASAPLRVMPLGDSITRGVGEPGFDSYRTVLARHLTRAGLRIDYVGSQEDGTGPDPQHEGHGGWTIDQLLAEVDGWLAAYQPDVILLHAGTNNISAGESGATTARKLGTLIDRIRAARPGAHLFIAKIITSRQPDEAARDAAYNDLIPALVAARRDPRMTVVDQSSVGGLDLHDLHHPNSFGYEKMAWNWYRGIADRFGLGEATGRDPYTLTRARLCVVEPALVGGQVQQRTACRIRELRPA